MKKINYTFLFLLAASTASAQRPVPAKPQSKSILLMNGVAHIGNGTVIENSVIGLKEGKIVLVADARTVRIQPTAWDTTINISGKHVYPGIIASNTTLGLVETESVRATRDFAEVGAFNPHIRSIIAYNTDSKVIPTARMNGVLMAQVTPRGGRICGSSSVMELDGWNWEDAAHKTDDGIHLNWPAVISRNFSDDGPGPFEKNKNYDSNLGEVEKFFTEAKAYCENVRPDEKNLRFEAMRGVFAGTQTLFIHADYVKEISEAVIFSKRLNIKKMVIVGGRDSWQCTALLKENNIPVMLGRTHDLPANADADVDQPFKTPYLLQKAGVLFCIQNEGDMEAPGTRNIPFLAGTTAAYGLTKEEALAAITGNVARILGIDDKTGTLQEGKDATLFVSTGDALDMRTNNVEWAFIRGKKLQLTSEQTELYHMYMKKYGKE
ncbi:MAG: metal-dependent hydrolase superfamily protein precursor [Bacteroidetes bacterium]|nr:MAG: metal-dependent hydrolase superfamily protein precursor [Bacteroidota bacterium]